MPFPLNPIIEKNDPNNFTSLVCSTPLKETSKLKFRWYRNEQLITNTNGNFEQVNYQLLKNENSKSLFTSELKFKIASNQLNGYYTCSLDYESDMITITRNESIILKTRSNSIFFDNKNLIKK